MNFAARILLIAASLVCAVGDTGAANPDSRRANSSPHIWQQWEHTLISRHTYTNPYADVTLRVTYTGPGDHKLRAYGFWDGGATFRIRCAFPATGTWRWETECSDAINTGLHQQSGKVEVTLYGGTNSLYQHGFLKVSDDHRYVVYADGTPFLWIGDTPWAAFVAATQEEWECFLRDRRENKFTVMQVHCGSGFLDRTTDRDGNPPFLGTGATLRWNPPYWQGVERKVRAANDQSLIVYICAVRQPGEGFPVNDAQEVGRFARNLAARLMGHGVAYSPVADDLWTPMADAAGEALNEASSLHLISAHPRFFLEPAVTFHGKDYIDVVGLQTGEGWTYDPYTKEPSTPFSTALEAQNAFQWPLALYRRTPVKPVINQEGPYDHPIEANGRMPLPPRKAGYWSFLSGACGHTYGAFGIWNWGEPVGWFPTYDFQTALRLSSVKHMKHLADFFGSIRWWTLEPAHELICNQPDDVTRRMVLARNAAGDLAVAYLPDNEAIEIDASVFPGPLRACWFDPVKGGYTPTADCVGNGGTHRFTPPAKGDWVLLVQQIADSGSLDRGGGR